MTPHTVRKIGAMYGELFQSKGVPYAAEPDTISLAPAKLLLSDSTVIPAIRNAVAAHRNTFVSLDIVAAKYPHEKRITPGDVSIAMLPHCYSMLSKIERFVDQGDILKCLRWLGFIKGVLWAKSMGTGGFVYCYGTISIIDDLAARGGMYEASYRLGLIQGALWVTGVYSLEELRSHNDSG